MTVQRSLRRYRHGLLLVVVVIVVAFLSQRNSNNIFGFPLLGNHTKKTIFRSDIAFEKFIRSSELNVGNDAELPDQCKCRLNTTGQQNLVENMCYRSKAGTGTPFDCSFLQHLKLQQLNLLSTDVDNSVMEQLVLANFTVPVVTGASDNHFGEAMVLVAETQRELPTGTRIIFYDLGLNHENAEKVRHMCQVEYRAFPFDRFPSQVRQLMQYRWKPLIIAMISKEFPGGFWWADTSIRWSEAPVDVYDFVNKETPPITWYLPPYTRIGVWAVTNPGMYKYLPVNIDKLKNATIFQAGFQLVVRSKVSRQILKCCHRFDQSAINILLHNLNQFNRTRIGQPTDKPTGIWDTFAKIAGSVHGDLPKNCDPAGNRIVMY